MKQLIRCHIQGCYEMSLLIIVIVVIIIIDFIKLQTNRYEVQHHNS